MNMSMDKPIALNRAEGTRGPQVEKCKNDVQTAQSGVQTGQSEVQTGQSRVQAAQSEVQKTPRWSSKGSDMVLDGPNVHPKLPKADRRASGMPWGPRSKGCAPEKYPARNIPPARKVPSEPSISIPLGIDRTQPWSRARD